MIFYEIVKEASDVIFCLFFSLYSFIRIYNELKQWAQLFL